jgi:hypothetical protein
MLGSPELCGQLWELLPKEFVRQRNTTYPQMSILPISINHHPEVAVEDSRHFGWSGRAKALLSMRY